MTHDEAGDVAPNLLDTEGPAAPPRRNGELLFGAPWEGRLFGLTMALHRAGVFEWDEFRQLLIEVDMGIRRIAFEGCKKFLIGEFSRPRNASALLSLYLFLSLSLSFYI